MLERPPRLMLAVPRQMHLAILAGDRAIRVDQDGGVEVAPLRSQLSVSKAETDVELLCEIEKRLHRRIRHSVLEEPINRRLVVEVPAGKEGGERQLWKHHQLRALVPSLPQEARKARNRGLAWLVAGDRAELRGGDGEDARHRLFRCNR